MAPEPKNPTKYYVPPLRVYENVIHEYPEFVDSANGDYNIGEYSPCRGTGEDGADMGAYFE